VSQGDDIKLVRVAQLETIVSLVLRFGVLLSLGVIAIGTILLFFVDPANAVVPTSGTPTPQNPADVLAAVGQLQPTAVIQVGLMLLIATPVIRVAVSVFAFLIEEDFVYTLVTLFVLSVLLLSFFLGRVE
ncbi:MAG TPA: DUF1634 domain-containing protein, partial [Chloroflexota bacterium]|nr:DUF1634 domain-containing protein [Chloroflexota bacterium]